MAIVTEREDDEEIREIYETLSASAGLTVNRRKVTTVCKEGHSPLGMDVDTGWPPPSQVPGKLAREMELL